MPKSVDKGSFKSKKMELSEKIASIKEKISALASKIRDLRSENELLTKENQELSLNLQQKVEKIDFLNNQLTALKEQIQHQSHIKVIEEEE